ncbi:MAG: hypothetical protein LBM98_02865 [Oscillospiraceae bacterium]|jgi:hypothetical protein|nr:hypothetical protein [Oscillospiraceae bacterium]
MPETTFNSRPVRAVATARAARPFDPDLFDDVAALNGFSEFFYKPAKGPFADVEEMLAAMPPEEAGRAFYSEANKRHLLESDAQSKRGEYVVKTLEELEEMAK